MYIHASLGAVVALALSSIAAIFIPNNLDLPQVETVLTASTFLFAIIAGFYLSRLNSRYDLMRDIIAKEDVLWLSLFQQSRVYKEPFNTQLADLIDNYYITAFDYPLGTSYKATTNTYLNAYRLLEATPFKAEERDGILLDDTYTLLKEIEEARNHSSVIYQERLDKGQWTILMILAFLIGTCLFLLASASGFMTMAFALLVPTLVLFLLVMRDLQNFRLGGTVLLGESGQEVLEVIGKPRYYNAALIDDGAFKVPDFVTTYRLGVHEPGSPERKMQLIER